MDFHASHMYAKTTARKARYVVDLIRGQPVNTALDTLRFVHRRAARLVEKVVRSALANAEQNVEVDIDSLYVSRALVDEGPLLGLRPRWRPISRGRAVQIRKRLSHIKITLSTAEEPVPLEGQE
jgi:large subunit ribosomal protein L22